MQTHQLKRKNPNTKRMIVARGGKRGKTAGRGGKGQSARAGNKRRPEWRDIIKRLPKLRGRGVNQNKFVTGRSYVVDLTDINEAFDAKSAITPATLVEKGLVTTQSGRIPPIKILSGIEISKAFVVSGCFVSKSAKDAIEKAGGTIAIHVPVVVAKVAPAKKQKQS
jgi:large subunit ribosomal protein L15